ncbi:hypothetical protein SUGI_1065310 [Cryptomeria japonica]|uniref:NAD(P)H:quinone oxidoreductase n=1 Tax=Cryptomeria japonica TaxID=3369 RepID=UPI002414940C|nr:NAD(P)H:quinone oxidoreductase [Cryptomeria japonica]GLJ50087.1 hypothetical protein SUGI_1065310 [Cryptomeria japonica]
MSSSSCFCFSNLFSCRRSRKHNSKIVDEANGVGNGPCIKKVFKVLAISGSLRNASCTHGLLRAAQKHAQNDPSLRMEIEIVSVDEMRSLPRLDPGLAVKNEKAGKGQNYYTYPAAVESFIKKVKAADCIIFSCPEYNYSITGVLKDALDWACIGPDNAWTGKAAAIMAVGGQDARGCRGTYHLRQIGVKLDLNIINKELFALHNPKSNEVIFDEKTGDLIDDQGSKNHPAAKINSRVKTILAALLQFAEKFPIDHSSD